MDAKNLRSRARMFWRTHVRPLLIMAIIVFSVRSSLADWNDVPTGSMKPTILEGDRVMVNKLAYDLKLPFTTIHIAEWGDPARGDIVVFFSPKDGKRLVKRVIGIPGDTVELRNNSLVINGRAVEYRPIEQELLSDASLDDITSHVYATELLPGQIHAVAGYPAVAAMRNFGPYKLPQDRYFMMGDNRDDSFDSRYFGPVERKSIVGRVPAVVISLDRNNGWSPRWNRFFSGLD